MVRILHTAILETTTATTATTRAKPTTRTTTIATTARTSSTIRTTTFPATAPATATSSTIRTTLPATATVIRTSTATNHDLFHGDQLRHCDRPRPRVGEVVGEEEVYRIRRIIIIIVMIGEGNDNL